MLEILSAIWDVLTYSHSGGNATLSFLPFLIGAGSAIVKGAGDVSERKANRKRRITQLRWQPYGVDVEEKKKGSILGDIVGGIQSGMSMGSAAGGLMGGAAPAVAGGMSPVGGVSNVGKTLSKGVGMLSGPRGIGSIAQASTPQVQMPQPTAEGVGNYNVGQAMGGGAPQMKLASSRWMPVGGKAPGPSLMDPTQVDPRFAKLSRGY